MKKKSPEEMRKIWAQITARAWEDRKFKEKLLAHPKEVAREYGCEIPATANIKIHENTSTTWHWVLYEKPEGLSHADLGKISAAEEGYNCMPCVNSK